jgi:hypothetical protein
MDSDASRALTGFLPWVVLIASALSLPLSFALLARYRNAVRAGMRATAGGPLSPPPAPGRTPATPLRFEELTDSTPASGAAAIESFRRAARGGWPLASVYACAGAGYAVVMATGEQMADAGAFFVPTRLAAVSWTYFWPAVLAAVIVAGYDRRRRWQLLGGYAAVFALITIVAVARNPGLAWLGLPLYWVLRSATPTALLMTFLLRPIRAAGPLVLAFMLVVTLGSQTAISVAALDDRLLRALVDIGVGMGMGATEVLVAIAVTGLTVFAAIGWPLLHWIGRRYQARKLSDQSLTIDSLFLLFGTVQSIFFVFSGPWWGLTGLVAFGVYKTIAQLAFRLRHSPAGDPHTLLLLRVFRLGKRSEQLFDRLRTHWQPVGSIAMIAGPDLATSTVEPHEFLEFVSGRLGRQFVTGPSDLDQRIAAMDHAPDLDGRHRIHEFFCRADTWQMTMQRLAAMSDAVLMDLRSFSPANQGCLFELGRLVDAVDLARVVFLVDGTTRLEFLHSTMAQLWAQASAASPNRRVATPAVRIYRIDRQSERTLIALMAHLLVRRTVPHPEGTR